MKIIENRYIGKDDLRKVCIEENYYTHGTNSDYDNLFSKIDGATLATTDFLYELAKDIYDHSEMLDFTENNGIAHIMFCLCRACATIFDIEE